MSRPLLDVCGGVFIAILMASPTFAAQATLPGATYESLRSLPDWSGWWGLEGPLSVEIRLTPPPLKPELLAEMRKVSTSDVGGLRDLHCRPSQFSGYSGGFVESVEFLFTPGRVTLTNESGLLRRIYTDGRTLSNVDASNTGTSVGHWEGQALVVETVGISPTALYPQAIAGSIPVGRNVKIVERISLRDADTLQFDITTTAPDIFTAPDKRVRVYSRVPKRTALQISFCSDFDRAIDPETGKQRFDMTPPPDLPPPPPR
jgi:hypothetical protein